MAALEVRAEPSDGSTASTLIEGFEAAIGARYPGWSRDVGPSATPADFAPPGGRFLVAYEDGRPLGCGGLKRLDEETVEIKRLYVAPDGRRRGVARAVLAALEDAARELGYRRVRLDTGDRLPEAVALFGSSGYTPIDDYNANPYAAHWFEKTLDPTP